MSKEIILSGIRPTGRLHIGNYFGLLKNCLLLQDQYECYFFIADLHSLNEPFDPNNKSSQITNLALDLLASGIDSKKCTLFVQSHLYEHAELAIILSNFIPVGYLFRMTQYKEKTQNKEAASVNAGLLYYPVLMAADILIYKSTLVPVGQDQTQHVEFARDTANFFNNKFGITFPEPKPLYTENPKIASLLAPEKKMSKSLGDDHCLYIDDDPEIIKSKLTRAPTDTGDGKSLGAQNLMNLAKIFCSKDAYQRIRTQQKNGNIQYSELKNTLAQSVSDYFAKFREIKNKLQKDPKKIIEILKQGAKKARSVASKTLKEVKEKIGIM